MEEVKEIINRYRNSGADKIHITDVAKIIEILQDSNKAQLVIHNASQRLRLLIGFARFWNSEGWHAEHILGSDLKRFEEQATPPIPKSAKETLYNSLMQSWQKTDWYNHEEKQNHILIAESYGLDELVKYFNETIDE